MDPSLHWGDALAFAALQRHQLLERAAIAGAHVQKGEGAAGVPRGPAGLGVDGRAEIRIRIAGRRIEIGGRRGRLSLEHRLFLLKGVIFSLIRARRKPSGMSRNRCAEFRIWPSSTGTTSGASSPSREAEG